MSLVLYHSPGTRSGSVRWLLEELEVPYELEIVDFSAEGGAPESYRAIQPNKKVPAIVHDGVAVHERAAIFAYLCDAFPARGLAPPIGDPRRGPYLSWLVYNDAVIDPVLGAKFMGWTYDKRGVSFGAYEDMLQNLETTLGRTAYLVGDGFTAADILVSGAINVAVNVLKTVPRSKVLEAYLTRTIGRPSFVRALAKDRALQS